ncbi:copper resistance protein CopB [Methylophaga sp. 42_8_T64]|nr:copper resistance protein CopB [Methylophaga sp. 41_12_T18]OUR86127.1 copper resistance protein CopB [Methylophaga sp. 42_8_T64]
MKLISFMMALSLSNALYAGGMDDDPILTMVKIDQLEKTDIGNDNNTAWQAQAWLGKDLNKVWLKTEGEVVDNTLEEAEFQLLYSRAIAPYWDAQIGWRHDSKPTPNRDWLAIGVQGLAPYFFDTDVALFIGEGGNVGLRAEFEYELLLSQKWILSPEIEANFFSKNDEDVQTGSGLSGLSAGLRLRYEIKREFAPYLGVEWKKSFGTTADYLREHGEDRSDVQWVLGIKAWF